MSQNITGGANPDTTDVNLIGNVTGNSVSDAWHTNYSPNHYAWLYIVGALVLLWGVGGVFRHQVKKGKQMLDSKNLIFMLVGVAVGYFVLAKYLGK